MKTKTAVFLLVAILFAAMAVVAQEKSVITVKGSELNNGVVIVDVTKDAKGYELQCNQGVPSCNQLKGGKYVMVQLPSNSGMYDCKDVQIFPESSANTDTDKKIGEYCLSEK